MDAMEPEMSSVSQVKFWQVPPEATAPAPDARGWICWQPSTGKVWRKIDGKWLPIAEANEIAEARRNSR